MSANDHLLKTLLAVALASGSFASAADKAPSAAVPKIVIQKELFSRSEEAVQADREQIREVVTKLNRSARAFGAAANCSTDVRDSGPTGSAFGAPVKKLRIIRFAPPRESMSRDELREKVRKVWTRKILDGGTFIGWAEPGEWMFQADVRFKDGTHGMLIADNWFHAVVTGHDGCTWFLRFTPNLNK